MKYLQYADKVAWIADIHCIGKGGYGWFGLKLFSLQVFCNNIVDITGCNKMFNR